MVWSDFEISQAFSVENFNNIGCVTNVSFWKLGSNFDIPNKLQKKSIALVVQKMLQREFVKNS